MCDSWAAAWQNQQNGMCAQRRLRSAWASTFSDQSLRCALSGKLRIQGFSMQTAKTDQSGRMPRLIWVFAGHTCHFVGFVVLRLISNVNLFLAIDRSITPIFSCLHFSRYLPSGLVRPYQLDKSISNFRGVWCAVLIFIWFLIKFPVNKQCRPWSEATFWRIWSVSTLFAYVPN